MKLRRQLLLVSLVTLCLPWAAYQYVNEMGRIMMRGEETAQRARTQAVTAYLASQPEILRDLLPRNSASRLFAPRTDQPLLLDGNLDDWPNQSSPSTLHENVSYRLLVVGQSLNLGLELGGNYELSSAEPVEVTLHTLSDNFRLMLSEDSRVYARRTPTSESPIEPSILGTWSSLDQQLIIELAMPLALTGGYFGLQVESFGQQFSTGISAESKAATLLTEQLAIQTAMQIFDTPDSALSMVTPEGQVVASAGQIEVISDLYPGWQNRLWNLLPFTERKEDLPKVTDVDFYQYWLMTENQPTVVTGELLEIGGIPLGWVQLESEVSAFVTLYTASMMRLILMSAIVFVAIGLGLLGYATWLSRRIRKLSLWTRTLIDEKGRAEPFEPSGGTDELGELSRDYADLTNRISRYTNYLQALAGRLSHEIRTPLTIIDSSLENLRESTNPEEQGRYLDRAREGVQRLRKLLLGMSAASSLEASIESSTKEEFSPDQLLHGLVESYRQAFSPIKIEFDSEVSGKPLLLNGSPDLFAQMMDKLVENAASFSESKGAIVIETVVEDGYWKIRIANKGPLLPVDSNQDIFASLVSLRDQNSGAEVHLGLGLSLVKRIVDFHGGRILADNLPDGSGVFFDLWLPLI